MFDGQISEKCGSPHNWFIHVYSLTSIRIGLDMIAHWNIKRVYLICNRPWCLFLLCLPFFFETSPHSYQKRLRQCWLECPEKQTNESNLCWTCDHIQPSQLNIFTAQQHKLQIPSLSMRLPCKPIRRIPGDFTLHQIITCLPLGGNPFSL